MMLGKLNRRTKKILLGLVSLAALPVIGLLYYQYGYDNFHAVLSDRIYRSAQLRPRELQRVVQQYGVQSIINLRGRHPGKKWYQAEAALAARNHIALYDVDLSSAQLPRYRQLQLLFGYLQTAPRPVLLHCLNGADRSGLASAIALALEKPSDLQEIKKQFSWRYFSLRPLGSIGRLFFDQYEQWLHSTARRHSRGALIDFFQQAYTDRHGNIEYWLDEASGARFQENWLGQWQASLVRPQTPILLRGWALDPRTHHEVESLQLIVGKGAAVPVTYATRRPDVRRHFNIRDDASRKKPLGWTARLDAQALAQGCHRVAMLVPGHGGPPRKVTTRFQLCLEP
jgi:undecaprenyl-diphosphatase